MTGDSDRTKRELRQQKREIKRKGNQRVRRGLKRVLAEHPEQAHEAQADYGRLSSAPLNGIDRHPTRTPRESRGDSERSPSAGT